MDSGEVPDRLKYAVCLFGGGTAPAKQLVPALPLRLGRPERDSGRVLFKTAQI